jgi:hypothetical protein
MEMFQRSGLVYFSLWNEGDKLRKVSVRVIDVRAEVQPRTSRVQRRIANHSTAVFSTTLSYKRWQTLILRMFLDSAKKMIFWTRGAQNSGARSRQNFVPWRLIFVRPQCGTCFMPAFWRLEF